MSYLEAMVKDQLIGLSRLGIRLSLLPRLKGRILIRGLVKMQSSYKASSQRNKKRRTFNEALREDVMYYIVSTGVDWVIIKLVNTGGCNDNDNGNVEVLLSSRTPFTFPINE